VKTTKKALKHIVQSLTRLEFIIQNSSQLQFQLKSPSFHPHFKTKKPDSKSDSTHEKHNLPETLAAFSKLQKFVSMLIFNFYLIFCIFGHKILIK